MATNDPAGATAQPMKSSRKELRLQVAAQIAAANYEATLGSHASGTLADRLERLLRDAESLIEANDQFQARIFAARKAADQGHEKGNG